MEFIAVQSEVIEKETGCRQPELTQEQKIRLAYRGKKLNEFLLGQIETVFIIFYISQGGLTHDVWEL